MQHSKMTSSELPPPGVPRKRIHEALWDDAKDKALKRAVLEQMHGAGVFQVVKPLRSFEKACLADFDSRVRVLENLQKVDWSLVALEIGGSNSACVRRFKSIFQFSGHWTPQEDAVIIKHVQDGGHKRDWAALAQKLPGRHARQLRDRWATNLDPEITRATWTIEEDRALIITLAENGRKWAAMREILPGRPPEMIKNRWNNFLRRTVFEYLLGKKTDFNVNRIFDREGLSLMGKDIEGCVRAIRAATKCAKRSRTRAQKEAPIPAPISVDEETHSIETQLQPEVLTKAKSPETEKITVTTTAEASHEPALKISGQKRKESKLDWHCDSLTSPLRRKADSFNRLGQLQGRAPVETNTSMLFQPDDVAKVVKESQQEVSGCHQGKGKAARPPNPSIRPPLVHCSPLCRSLRKVSTMPTPSRSVLSPIGNSAPNEIKPTVLHFSAVAPQEEASIPGYTPLPLALQTPKWGTEDLRLLRDSSLTLPNATLVSIRPSISTSVTSARVAKSLYLVPN